MSIKRMEHRIGKRFVSKQISWLGPSLPAPRTTPDRAQTVYDLDLPRRLSRRNPPRGTLHRKRFSVPGSSGAVPGKIVYTTLPQTPSQRNWNEIGPAYLIFRQVNISHSRCRKVWPSFRHSKCRAQRKSYKEIICPPNICHRSLGDRHRSGDLQLDHSPAMTSAAKHPRIWLRFSRVLVSGVH